MEQKDIEIICLCEMTFKDIEKMLLKYASKGLLEEFAWDTLIMQQDINYNIFKKYIDYIKIDLLLIYQYFFDHYFFYAHKDIINWEIVAFKYNEYEELTDHDIIVLYYEYINIPLLFTVLDLV